MEVRHFVAYTDGGSRGNPGPAASSFVLYETFTDGSRHHVVTKGFYIGEQTNNVAEYDALVKLLTEVNQIDPANCSLTVFADSLLMVNQVNGRWAIKNTVLKGMADEVKALSRRIFSVEFHHVGRELNKDADLACNKVLDKVENLESSLEGPIESSVHVWYSYSASVSCAKLENVY